MKYLIVLVLLSGCSKEESRTFSFDELEHRKTLTLSERILMDDCLNKYDSVSYAHCMRLTLKPEHQVTQQSNGQSVLKTAAGVALGYGAVKMITGNKK